MTEDQRFLVNEDGQIRTEEEPYDIGKPDLSYLADSIADVKHKRRIADLAGRLECRGLDLFRETVAALEADGSVHARKALSGASEHWSGRVKHYEEQKKRAAERRDAKQSEYLSHATVLGINAALEQATSDLEEASARERCLLAALRRLEDPPGTAHRP